MQTQKIHPNVISDESGLKFLFNFDGNHYTMRFSGKPLHILEEWYRMLGGNVTNFPALYDNIRAGNGLASQKDILLVKQALDKSEEFFKVLQRLGNKNISPFTIYAQPFDIYKYGARGR